MPAKALSDAVLHETLRAVATAGGNMTEAGRLLGLDRVTVSYRRSLAAARGMTTLPATSHEKPASPAPIARIDTPAPAVVESPRLTGFEDAWRILAGQIGMREDRYAGPSQRPRGTKVLVLSDLHAPFHDPRMVAQAMADNADADTCIFAGDIGDGYGWSRFTKYETVSYEDEIAAVTAIVQMASERFRQVEIFDGNHDGPRLERQLRERLAPEMISAITYMTGGTLSPIHALAKRYPNVRIVGHVTPDGRRVGWLYQRGDVVISHAEKFSITPGAAVRKIEEWLADMEGHLELRPWRVLIQAHTHQFAMIPWHADRLLLECGCLCQQHGYQLAAKIGGRPQRRGYVTFDQDTAGRVDVNSVRFYSFDAERARQVA